eukprot:6198566-Pleurochrysis_carterae.AAC.8
MSRMSPCLQNSHTWLNKHEEPFWLLVTQLYADACSTLLSDDNLESTDISSCSSSSKTAARRIETVLSPLTKLEGGRKRPAIAIPDLCTAALAIDGAAHSPSLMDWFGDAPTSPDLAASKRKRPRCLYMALSAVGALEESQRPCGSIDGSAPSSPASPITGWTRTDSIVAARKVVDLYCNETLADAEMYCDEELPQSTLESAPLHWLLPNFSATATLGRPNVPPAESGLHDCTQYSSPGAISSLRAPNAPVRPVLFLPGKKILKPRALFPGAT